MSVVVIFWENDADGDDIFGGGFGHAALLLNGLVEPVYISVYPPKDGKRFSSVPTVASDIHGYGTCQYVVIPSQEDGHPYALSESAMAWYWQNVYGIKKVKDDELSDQKAGDAVDLSTGGSTTESGVFPKCGGTLLMNTTL